MMKKYFSFLCFVFVAVAARSQQGYDIRINYKGCKDSTVYLARYFWDQLPIIDSCKNIKNGKIQFKSGMTLEKGVYFLANQARTSYYFQFIVDDNQNFTINTDGADMINTLKSPDDKQNEQFFSYVKFMTGKNREMAAFAEQAKGKGKADSTKFVAEKHKQMNEQVMKFESDFFARNKGTFVAYLMNMRAEKYATDVPKASNGRPDSVYQYYYYKTHYFDNTNFKDERTIYTPFFADRVKKYFEHLVFQHPDSVIKELDNILGKATPGSTLYNTLVGHFTYKYEQNKTMSFDQYGKCNTFEKVFIHLADKYIVSGKTDGYYSAETITKIKEKVDILRNLLPGAQVSDLFVIDTVHAREVLKMGFDTASTSGGATYLYQKNQDRLATMFKTLYGVKAKYTVLVFWAADCSHCQTEIPKLNEELAKVRGKIDHKVFAVQTKEDLFETWRKFIIDKKLTEFIHVFDPVHINSVALKERFDIVATPVIYLLDKEKRVIGKKLSPDQVVEIMEKLESIEKSQNK